MHPDLLNNPLFLNYYGRWQKDPSSVLFAPIAEFFLNYGLIDEAMQICREGLKRHPALLLGRLVMAKIQMKLGNFEEAADEAEKVLKISPANPSAREIINKSHEKIRPRENSNDNQSISSVWQTVTMARLYAAQGNQELARKIYRTILKKDPHNLAAKQELESIDGNTQ